MEKKTGLSTFILSMILSTLLCTSSSWMLATAYELDVLLFPVVLFALLFSFMFGIIHMKGNKAISITLLILTPIAVRFVISGGIFNTDEAFETVMFVLKRDALRQLPFTFADNRSSDSELTSLFVILNTVPIVFSTFALIRLKRVLWSVLFALPYVFCSVALVYQFPSQAACEIFFAAVLLMALTEICRKRKNEITDKGIIALIVPVIVVLMMIGVIFPQDSYDKDELADKSIVAIKDWVQRSPFSSKKKISEIIDSLNGDGKRADALRAAAESVGIVSDADTDLNDTGDFDPPSVRICNVMISVNSEYYSEGNAPSYTPVYLYLKTSSKDIYRDNVWSSSDISEEPFDDESAVPGDHAQYRIRFEYYGNTSVHLTPYYTDFYMVPGENGSYSYNVVGPYNSTPGSNSITAFNLSCVPVHNTHFSDDYLYDYVYDEALEVPEETRQALIDSGMLPDTYMRVLNGEISLSVADKITLVTNYVRNLHHYDAHTGYPPDNEDFVVWFITESNSGYCVHYASAAVILLRMIGVPARYVDGYLLNVGSFSTNTLSTVYSTDAHAWFEAFVPEFGWVMGDAAPGNFAAAGLSDINAVAAAYPEYFESSSDITVDPSGSGQQTQPSSSPDTTEPSGGTTDDGSTPIPLETTDGTVPDDASGAGNGGSFEWKVPAAVVVVVGLFAVFIMARLVFIIFWERRFGSGSVNARARAYYNYYRLTGKVLGAGRPKKATAIAEKAAFGNKQITQEELDMLIKVCKKRNRMVLSKARWYMKVVYRLLSWRTVR